MQGENILEEQSYSLATVYVREIFSLQNDARHFTSDLPFTEVDMDTTLLANLPILEDILQYNHEPNILIDENAKDFDIISFLSEDNQYLDSQLTQEIDYQRNPVESHVEQNTGDVDRCINNSTTNMTINRPLKHPAIDTIVSQKPMSSIENILQVEQTLPDDIFEDQDMEKVVGEESTINVNEQCVPGSIVGSTHTNKINNEKTTEETSVKLNNFSAPCSSSTTNKRAKRSTSTKSTRRAKKPKMDKANTQVEQEQQQTFKNTKTSLPDGLVLQADNVTSLLEQFEATQDLLTSMLTCDEPTIQISPKVRKLGPKKAGRPRDRFLKRSRKTRKETETTTLKTPTLRTLSQVSSLTNTVNTQKDEAPLTAHNSSANSNTEQMSNAKIAIDKFSEINNSTVTKIKNVPVKSEKENNFFEFWDHNYCASSSASSSFVNEILTENESKPKSNKNKDKEEKTKEHSQTISKKNNSLLSAKTSDTTEILANSVLLNNQAELTNNSLLTHNRKVKRSKTEAPKSSEIRNNPSFVESKNAQKYAPTTSLLAAPKILQTANNPLCIKNETTPKSIIVTTCKQSHVYKPVIIKPENTAKASIMVTSKISQTSNPTHVNTENASKLFIVASPKTSQVSNPLPAKSEDTSRVSITATSGTSQASNTPLHVKLETALRPFMIAAPQSSQNSSNLASRNSQDSSKASIANSSKLSQTPNNLLRFKIEKAPKSFIITTSKSSQVSNNPLPVVSLNSFSASKTSVASVSKLSQASNNPLPVKTGNIKKSSIIATPKLPQIINNPLPVEIKNNLSTSKQSAVVAEELRGKRGTASNEDWVVSVLKRSNSIVTTTNSSNDEIRNIIVQNAVQKPKRKMNLNEYRKRQMHRNNKMNSAIQPRKEIFIHQAGTNTQPFKNEAGEEIWCENVIISAVKSISDIEEKNRSKPPTCDMAVQTYETVFGFPQNSAIQRTDNGSNSTHSELASDSRSESRSSRSNSRDKRSSRSSNTSRSKSGSSSTSRDRKRSRSSSEHSSRSKSRNNDRRSSTERSKSKSGRKTSNRLGRWSTSSSESNSSRNRKRSERSSSRSHRYNCHSYRRRRHSSDYSDSDNSSPRRSYRSSSSRRSRSRSRLTSRTYTSSSRSCSRSNLERRYRSSRQNSRDRTDRYSKQFSDNYHNQDRRSGSPYRYNNLLTDNKQTREGEERRIIYVGHLEKSISSQDLYDMFRKYGPIASTSVHPRNENGNFGFVTFKHQDDACRALENGKKNPYFASYELSFGGRRAFCKVQYTDLDGMGSSSSSSDRMSPMRQTSFDMLLAQEINRHRLT